MRQIRVEHNRAALRYRDGSPAAAIPPLPDANEVSAWRHLKLQPPEGWKRPNPGAIDIDHERAHSWIAVPSATQLNDQPSCWFCHHRRTVTHAVRSGGATVAVGYAIAIRIRRFWASLMTMP